MLQTSFLILLSWSCSWPRLHWLGMLFKGQDPCVLPVFADTCRYLCGCFASDFLISSWKPYFADFATTYNKRQHDNQYQQPPPQQPQQQQLQIQQMENKPTAPTQSQRIDRGGGGMSNKRVRELTTHSTATPESQAHEPAKVQKLAS